MGDGSKRSDVVLVVDNSPDTLSFLKDTVELTGATVLLALSGDAALSIVEHVTPDTILLDAVMPGIDGFETCRRLKQMSGLTDAPVIFMTGLSAAEDVIKGLEVGGIDTWRSPLVPEVLVARIRVYLSNARSAQSAGGRSTGRGGTCWPRTWTGESFGARRSPRSCSLVIQQAEPPRCACRSRRHVG